MAGVSPTTAQAAHNSGMSVKKMVAVGGTTAFGAGLANNYINQKYIAPKYSRSERYYSKRLKDGSVLVTKTTHPSQ